MTIIDNSGQDLTDSVKPYFRNNKYSDGISNYLSLVEGKYLGTNSSNNSIINDISYQFTNPKTVFHKTNKYLMILLIPLFIITFVAFMIKKMFNYLFGLESYSPRYTPPKYHGSGITQKSSPSSSYSSSNKDDFLLHSMLMNNTSSYYDSSSSSSYDSSSFDSGGFDGGGSSGDW